MKHRSAAIVLALPLTFSGCAQLVSAEKTVCTDIAKIPAYAVVALDAQDTHSALGIIWANVKSGCANGMPVVGVDESWRSMLWGEAKVLIPQVLPQLLFSLTRLL